MATGTHDPRYQGVIALLKSAREAAGLSQEEVAKRLGRIQQFVSKYESGERRLDLIELVDVAAVLDVSTIDLLRQAGSRLSGLPKREQS